MTKEGLRLSPLRDSVSKGKQGCVHRRTLDGLHCERNVPRPGTAAQESIRTVAQNPNKGNFIFTILKFHLHKENSRVCLDEHQPSFWESMDMNISFEIVQGDWRVR